MITFQFIDVLHLIDFAFLGAIFRQTMAAARIRRNSSITTGNRIIVSFVMRSCFSFSVCFLLFCGLTVIVRLLQFISIDSVVLFHCHCLVNLISDDRAFNWIVAAVPLMVEAVVMMMLRMTMKKEMKIR